MLEQFLIQKVGKSSLPLDRPPEVPGLAIHTQGQKSQIQTEEASRGVTFPRHLSVKSAPFHLSSAVR